MTDPLFAWAALFRNHGASFRSFCIDDPERPFRVELTACGRSGTVKGVNPQDAYRNAAQVVAVDPLLASLEDEV